MPRRTLARLTRWKEFKYGDRVLYIGGDTHELRNCTGIVTKVEDRQGINISNIPVWWEGIGKLRGVFPHNVELIGNQEPDWEL